MFLAAGNTLNWHFNITFKTSPHHSPPQHTIYPTPHTHNFPTIYNLKDTYWYELGFFPYNYIEVGFALVAVLELYFV